MHYVSFYYTIISQLLYFTKASANVDENKCQECGCTYDDDEHTEAWIGCDNDDYGQWFHYRCAGFHRKLSSRKQFIAEDLPNHSQQCIR